MVVNQSSWKVNDADWMSNRKLLWKDYEYNLKKQVALEEDNFPEYEEYFLTGSSEARNTFCHPNDNADVVIEMWLHAENNLDTFKKIAGRFERLKEAQIFFKYSAPRGDGDEFRGKSRLNGKDLNIYKAIFPEHFSRQLFPLDSDEEFEQEAFNVYIEWLGRFIAFMDRKEIMPYDYCLISVPYWRDAFIYGYREHEYLQYIVEDTEKYASEFDLLHPLKRQLLEEISTVLDDPELPQDAKLFIDNVRKNCGN